MNLVGPFSKGAKRRDFNYGVTISERLTSVTAEAVNVLIPTKTSYGFEVKPEQEFRFIKKLPAGTYQVGEVKQLGFSNLYVILAVNFTVRPKQTTYIGRSYQVQIS